MWLQEHRRFWVLVLAIVVALNVAFYAAMAWWPGDQTWTCGLVTGMLLGAFVALRDSPPTAVQNWEVGAWGEQMTAKELDRLDRAGWTVLHDLPRGAYNIDHVVIGPGGVFCLNSKRSANRLEVDRRGHARLTNRYDAGVVSTDDKMVRRVRAEAVDVAKLVEQRTGSRHWVTPVIVWWGPFEQRRRFCGDVLVVHGEDLVDVLAHQPPRPLADAAAVAAALDPTLVGAAPSRDGLWRPGRRLSDKLCPSVTAKEAACGTTSRTHASGVR